ncbi:hypothetical protein VST7929_01786 [Vibrio stylophorae]|uniref:DUF2057 domain-containing protein n=1 Tax=Vibrio stylophorae TaxID=659351 RepID=A0ABM8ZUC8_9VIBR|nr:DUF2057 family protein [Vibrio stylophorae]CAH0533909.1 hypothetical protein VST7929_01786 [Vibrio stylophorae]
MRIWLSIVLTLFTMSVSAATLTLGRGIDAIAINGEMLPHNTQKQLSLQSGEYQLIIRFDQQMKDGSRKKQFTSKPYVLSFHVSGDMTLLAPLSTREYRKMAYAFRDQTPQWQLKDGKGETIAFTQVVLPGKSGFAPYQDMPAVVAAFYQQPAAAQPAQQSLKLAPNSESEALRQLKLWYEQATPADRQAFAQWLAQQ